MTGGMESGEIRGNVQTADKGTSNRHANPASDESDHKLIDANC